MSLRTNVNALWRSIATVSPTLTSPDQQQQAHLLVITLAALLLAGTVILPIWVIANLSYTQALPIAIGLYLGLLIAYAFSKSIHYQIGAWILIFSMYGLIIAVLVTAPKLLPERILVLNFLAIGILLASLFLSVRATVYVTGLSLLIISRYFFMPGIDFAITYSFLVFTIITSALIVTTTVIRRNYVNQLRASETRYRTLLEATPDLMFRFNRAGVYLDYHAGSLEKLASEPPGFMGKSMHEVLPHDIAKAAIQSFEKVLSSGKMDIFEYTLNLQGKDAYFEARSVQCGPDEILSIVRDVTERHLAEIALKQSEERFSKAFRNSPIPMVISTADRDHPVYIEANDAYLNLVGYTWDELQAQSLSQAGVIMNDERREYRLTLLDTQGSYPVQEAQVYNRNHEVRDVLLSAQRSVVNGIECDIELLLDVTEQRRLEKKAYQLEIEAKNMQILSKFIQDASHEFRTPLADLSNRLYLLSRVKDDTQRERHANQAQKQIQAVTNLLDMLFIMARLDSGLPFELAPTDINSFLRTMLSVYELQIRANKLTLELDLMAELPHSVVDPEYLQYALRQLVDNAIRYTPEGGKITVRTAHVDQTVIVSITDTGIGIAPEDLPHVFERFWRVDQAHTTPGFGLGLSTAQKILLQLGGSIKIDSTVGKGTTVTMALPPAQNESAFGPSAITTPQPQN